MNFNLPSDFNFKPKGEKYIWTLHSLFKMKYYGISQSRVKRVINYPQRYEEGIVPNTVAVMQVASTKKRSEIWVMYKIVDVDLDSKGENVTKRKKKTLLKSKAIKIITVWRYPGVSPKRNPIPSEVLSEIQHLLK